MPLPLDRRPARLSLALAALLAASLLIACGAGNEGPQRATASPTGSASPTLAVTTTPQGGPTPPATPTPMAAPSRPPEKGYRLAPAVPSAAFDNMLGFAMLPGSRIEAVVVTQSGQIWRVRVEGEATPELFGDVSDRLIRSPGAEEGLLGLAFSPAFQTDGLVYLYYTAGQPRRSVLSRLKARGDALDPASEEVILEVPQPFANHNGGQIAFGPDGYLYVALGDGGGGDPFGNGQNLSTLLGSILRIDVSGQGGYRIPPDNPFVDTPGARPEIFAYGLRNPWRFSFDRATGQLWAGDVGQNRWEEVDRIVPGANYGWSIMEGPECFRAPDCDQRGLRLPRAAYPTREAGSCAIIGGHVYRGPSMPELDGWFVYGDFCSGLVWAVNTAGDSPPVLLADTGLGIASFGELPDGELLAVTFDKAIFRLERAP